jgi:hypothetical protein
MFDFYRNFRSFLNAHRYASQAQLIAELGEKVICPAELKVFDADILCCFSLALTLTCPSLCFAGALSWTASIPQSTGAPQTGEAAGTVCSSAGVRPTRRP